MIHGQAIPNVPVLEEREYLFSLDELHGYQAVVSAEADKGASAIAREAERVRTIRLLVDGANED
jgi:hypothetical protein